MMSSDGAKPLMKTPAACILLQVNFRDVLWNMVAGSCIAGTSWRLQVYDQNLLFEPFLLVSSYAIPVDR